MRRVRRRHRTLARRPADRFFFGAPARSLREHEREDGGLDLVADPALAHGVADRTRDTAASGGRVHDQRDVYFSGAAFFGRPTGTLPMPFSRINASMSSGFEGNAALSTTQPCSVTSTTSSMRQPIALSLR